jgi:hypothetical protein
MRLLSDLTLLLSNITAGRFLLVFLRCRKRRQGHQAATRSAG